MGILNVRGSGISGDLHVLVHDLWKTDVGTHNDQPVEIRLVVLHLMRFFKLFMMSLIMLIVDAVGPTIADNQLRDLITLTSLIPFKRVY